MPNARDPRKKKVGAWLEPEEEQEMKAALASLGFDTLADCLRHLRELRRTKGDSQDPKSSNSGGVEKKKRRS